MINTIGFFSSEARSNMRTHKVILFGHQQRFQFLIDILIIVAICLIFNKENKRLIMNREELNKNKYKLNYQKCREVNVI